MSGIHHATPLPSGKEAPDFELPVDPGSEGHALGVTGAAGGPRLLPRGLEPRVLRPVGAVSGRCFRSSGSSNAELVGISVDSVWSHLAFAKDRNLHFPLLSDFEPKGEVARTFQVYRANEGTAERALFVIDADGIIRWSYVSPVGVNPGADGILRALENLGKEEPS